MDIATLVGILLGVVSIGYGIGGPEISNGFLSLSSALVVFGGGLSSTFISFRLSEVAKVMKVVIKIFKGEQSSSFETIKMLVDMSQQARREGLLALESSQENIEDEYLKQSLELVVDGVEPEIIRDAMDLELENLKIRHEQGQAIFKTMGSMFPAWGMIGTLIGLIKLLASLEDPETIAPAMALALITTLYGSIIANFVCLPIAKKLELKSNEEVRLKEMIIEGVLSIQSGENPRIMEHRLKTFLSPEQKKEFAQSGGDGSEGGDDLNDEVAG